MTLERIDNHGHYERGNARWATRTQQNNNTRRNRQITAFGRTRTLARWVREVGLNYHVVLDRLRRGWSPEDALTRPIDRLAGRFGWRPAAASHTAAVPPPRPRGAAKSRASRALANRGIDALRPPPA
jgi:hypothetical protein